MAFAILVLGLALLGWAYYHLFESSAFSGSVEGEMINLVIPSDNATLQTIGDSLRTHGFSEGPFWSVLTSRMNYTDDKIKPGRYEIQNTTNRIDLIRLLRSGRQKPVVVTFNNILTLEQLAGKLSRNLELDSLELLNHLDTLHSDDQMTFLYFIPDSYQVYYNVGPTELVDKFKRETEKFWSINERQAQLKKLGMSAQQVYILASIVERESQQKKEQPSVASVYHNRLRKGMKLQADPTVVFANGDFSLRRVLNKHLTKDSPYNTYRYEGLPPGPICMPSKTALQAALYPAETDYIFFCAKPGYSSEHAFASSLSAHNANARRYQKWLTSEGIR